MSDTEEAAAMSDTEEATAISDTEETTAMLETEEATVMSDTEEVVATTEDRVSALETEIRTSKGRIDAFSQELKLLLVEVNIVHEWIQQKFGVELIDKGSHFFKHIHDFEEIEDLTSALSLLGKGGGKLRDRKAKLQAKLKRRHLPHGSDHEAEDGEENENNEAEGFFDPPECVLETDGDGEEGPGPSSTVKVKVEPKTKRKRGRKKKEVKDILKQKLKRDASQDDDAGEDDDGQPEAEEDDDDDDEEVGEGEGEDGETAKPKKKYVWKPATQELGEGQMQCEECGKILKGDSSLRCHMLMHADLRPHQCEEPGCGKRFRNKTKLGQHIKIHGSEKTEICNFCGRGFLRKKDLVIHERTHTGEKPFACHDCPKSFNIKEHLTIHKRVHTGERPYSCEICNKAFSQANSLRIHKKIHQKAGEANPAIRTRKPRGPRKRKLPAVSSGVHWIAPKPEDVPLDASTSNVSNPGTGSREQPTQSPSVHNTPTPMPSSARAHEDHSGGGGQQHAQGQAQQSMPSMTAEQQHSLLVQSFFQHAQQSLDPVQQGWNFGGNNSGGQEERGGASHSPLPQPHNLALHHPQPHSSGFQVKHFYQQPQQNLSVARNNAPPHHVQTGPFSIPQFHDPTFRHFPH